MLLPVNPGLVFVALIWMAVVRASVNMPEVEQLLGTRALVGAHWDSSCAPAAAHPLPCKQSATCAPSCMRHPSSGWACGWRRHQGVQVVRGLGREWENGAQVSGWEGRHERWCPVVSRGEPPPQKISGTGPNHSTAPQITPLQPHLLCRAGK